MSESFNFWTPISSIRKGGDGRPEDMLIEGIASTNEKDADGEHLDPRGFELGELLSKGYFNWHHDISEPSCIIGEPLQAEVKELDNGYHGLFIKGRLYVGNKKAEQVYSLAKALEKSGSKRRLGFSVEGKVIERDLGDSSHIKKSKITNIAITPLPKNKGSIMNISKGLRKGEYYDALPTSDYMKDNMNALRSALKGSNLKIAVDYKRLSDVSDEILLGGGGEYERQAVFQTLIECISRLAHAGAVKFLYN